ncbi:MAG: GTPase HflX [Pseudomonadota bacterium]
MKKPAGNVSGLKASQLKSLEDLYFFKTSPDHLVSSDQALAMARLSREIRCQIAVMINRSGKTEHVIVGDALGIEIPAIEEYRAVPGRLKGLRCIHTHLGNDPLSAEDLTDLALLRLDFMASISVTHNGDVGDIHMGHVLPGQEGPPHVTLPPITLNGLAMDCLQRIQALESELTRMDALYSSGDEKEKAMLINAVMDNHLTAQDSMDELRELCRSSNIKVVDTLIQRRKKIDPQFVVGRGKLGEIAIRAIQCHATMLIFDRELYPSQIRSITDFVEMKVIDRTQLILDIFAHHAKSSEGKLQVELAQMKYLLPRLVTKNTAMSRLTGGIGGRGPGETKLEINRRRVRERIERLTKEIAQIRKQRKQQRSRRNRKGVPVISIVGYTNAGKSTLLNTLTNSTILAADRLFATLDPSSRRLKFPRDIEVIITDTVGFIQDLPDELMEAFHATLEELEDADILLHVIDISNPRYEQQMKAVETIIQKLNLEKTPVLHVFNKIDRIDLEAFDNPWLLRQGFPVSALDQESLKPLVNKLQSMVLE